MPSDLGWQDDAACTQVDPDMFFPGEGATGWASAKEAKIICSTCPVIAECLNYAISNHITEGIWAGKSLAQRRKAARVA